MKKIQFLFMLTFLSCSIMAQSYVPVKNDKMVKIAPVVDMKAWAFNLRDVKLLAGLCGSDSK